MEKFIGREKELLDLNEASKSERFEFAAIYGRRRVGKSSLINKFLNDQSNKVIRFTGIEHNNYLNLKYFSAAVFSIFPQGRKYIEVFDDWDRAFKYIYDQIGNEKLTIFIDEFPYIASDSKSITSILQIIIDDLFINNANIMLILCGSSMSFMEEQVLGHKSPLYGRTTMKMKIKPFSFFKSNEMFIDRSKLDKMILYGIHGGVPHYMALLNGKSDTNEAIISNIFNKSGSLYDEPINLLRQELSKPTTYYSIIESIASGSTKLNEIEQKSKIDSKKISTYIDKLQKLGLVEKENPFGNKKNRRGIYRLKDNLFRFWFKYVTPNQTNIENDMGDQVYLNDVLPDLNNYLSYVFEDVSVQYLQLLNKENKLPFTYQDIGRWWGNNNESKKEEEIDIIAANKDEAIFGECKWKNKKINLFTIKDLIRKSKMFGFKKKYYYFFSKSGYTEAALEFDKITSNVKLITYDDMV